MLPIYEAAGVWTAGFHVALSVCPLTPSLSLIKARPFNPLHRHLLLFLSSSYTPPPS